MASTLERVDASDPPPAPHAGGRERGLARTDGTFIVEGETVLRAVAGRTTFALRSLLLGESRVGKLTDVLERLPDGTRAFVLPQAAMDGLVGFPIHRGVLALAERGEGQD